MILFVSATVNWLTEPFALGFQQRALIGGLIAAVMTAPVGVWLVLRGMSFFGDAFMHGILPGIAAGLLFGFNPYIGAAVAAVVMTLGIELVHRQTSLAEDTGIGLLFVGMLALGVVIISKSRSYSGSLTSVLFGDPFGVTRSDLWFEAALAVGVVIASAVLYRPLLALAFSQPKAKALGMRPELTHALLLVLIAASVIGSFKSVGSLLVFGLLVGPPATAALLARTVPRMFVYSFLLSVFSVVAGLVISYHLDTAGAATMALVPVTLFFIVLAGRSLAHAAADAAHRPEAAEAAGARP